MALPLLASGLPQFCESCCPCGLHCVISGLLAGGSPGFRSVLCWFLFSQSLCMAAFVIVACFAFFCSTAIPIYRMIPRMIQCCHPSSSCRRGADLLISLPPFCFGVCGCLFVLVLLVLFVCFVVCVVCVFSVGIVTAKDLVLVLLQFNFCSLPS